MSDKKYIKKSLVHDTDSTMAPPVPNKKAKRTIPPLPKKNANPPLPPVTKKAPVPPTVQKKKKKAPKVPPAAPHVEKKKSIKAPLPPVPKAPKKRPAETTTSEGPDVKRRRFTEEDIPSLVARIEQLEQSRDEDLVENIVKKILTESVFNTDVDLNASFAPVLTILKDESANSYQNVISVIQKVVDSYVGDSILSIFEDDTVKEYIFAIIREYTAKVVAEKQKQAK